MAEQSDTLVFVPAWNEEENLPAVLEELQHELPGADVLVVDDGSTDGTVGVATEHGADVLVSTCESCGLIAFSYTVARAPLPPTKATACCASCAGAARPRR